MTAVIRCVVFFYVVGKWCGLLWKNSHVFSSLLSIIRAIRYNYV